MKFRSMAMAALLAALGSAASAALVTQDNGAYTITYNDATPGFGALATWGDSGTAVDFQWNMSSAVSAALLNGGSSGTPFDLPSFTIVANPGWALSGPVKGFLGNLAFTELNGGTASVSYAGQVGLVGGPSTSVTGSLDRTVTLSGPGFAQGIFSGTLVSPAGPLPSLALSGASISLNLSGAGPASFASILSQPQNQFKVSFQVAALPIPEPGTYAMLLAGLAAMGLLRVRQRG